MNDKGALVTGTVKSVEPKGAVIQLSEEVEGYLRASELSRDRVEDAGTHLKVGDTVEAISEIDPLRTDYNGLVTGIPQRTGPRKAQENEPAPEPKSTN